MKTSIESEKPTILIAEDEEINRTILREILKSKYRVLEAENGSQAVFCIQAEATNISLIILDIHMPKLDGFGVMDYLNKSGLNERIPVIITTADESPEILIEGKKNKVVDIVYKPFRAADILKTVETLVKLVELEQSLSEVILQKNEYLTAEYNAVKKAMAFHHSKWKDNVQKVVDTFLPEYSEHNNRIKNYTEFFCTAFANKYPRYGLSKTICRAISDACILHDLGIVVVPDELFNKNDPSASRAIRQIRQRPIAGSELVNMMFANSAHQIERKYAFEICRCLYETFDGKGYPTGLTGSAIPISAQIVGLMHQYDTLRFPPAGNSVPHKSVMKKLLEADYKAYNPDLLDVLEEFSETIEKISNGEYEKGE